MRTPEPLLRWFGGLAERLDALSLRERGIIFGAGAILIFIAWQTLLMGPLTMRERNAEQRLQEARRQIENIDRLGSAAAAAADPLVAAASRNRSLEGRLSALDAELRTAAEGYIEPGRMTEMMRRMLAEQHGLKLVSLKNLPVESLSRAAKESTGDTAGAADPTDSKAVEVGPYLHPVEFVVEGDYASLVTYLRALEDLPWRLHWQQLELKAGDASISRVRIKIGALSLHPEWMSL